MLMTMKKKTTWDAKSVKIQRVCQLLPMCSRRITNVSYETQATPKATPTARIIRKFW